MTAAPLPTDDARHGRALDRLLEHCELAVQRSQAIEERRVAVRDRLEQELGPDLTRTLLCGLAPA
jgi:hypothetical protein